MSTTRDSVFYSDIQDLLEKKLPEHGYPVPAELLQEILNDLFDSVALHVWSREDVIQILKREGWPVSVEAVDEILSIVEGHIDCEFGITWQTLESAIDDFYSSVNWRELSKEKQRQYQGTFLLKLERDENLPPSKSYVFDPKVWQGDYRLLKDKNLQEVFDEAEKVVKESNIPLGIYGIEADCILRKGLEEEGEEIADFYPDDFEEEPENE